MDTHRHEFHPSLDDCVLEDRVVPAQVGPTQPALPTEALSPVNAGLGQQPTVIGTPTVPGQSAGAGTIEEGSVPNPIDQTVLASRTPTSSGIIIPITNLGSSSGSMMGGGLTSLTANTLFSRARSTGLGIGFNPGYGSNAAMGTGFNTGAGTRYGSNAGLGLGYSTGFGSGYANNAGLGTGFGAGLTSSGFSNNAGVGFAVPAYTLNVGSGTAYGRSLGAGAGMTVGPMTGSSFGTGAASASGTAGAATAVSYGGETGVSPSGDPSGPAANSSPSGYPTVTDDTQSRNGGA